MTASRCPGCGLDTLTFNGWAHVDHCAHCGRVLGTTEIDRLATKARAVADALARNDGAPDSPIRRPPAELDRTGG